MASRVRVDEGLLRRALEAPPGEMTVPGARPAAVVVPVLLDGDDARVVVLVRAADLRDHAGEAGFPGGKPDPGDASLAATALRELEEELGTPATDVELLGALMAIPVIDRRYLIHPFVGLASPGARFRVASPEVAAVYTLPLGPILSGERPYFAVQALWRGAEAIAPHFELREEDRLDGAPAEARRVLYGASAYVLCELFVRLAGAAGVAVPPPVMEETRPWGDRYRHFER